MITLTKDLKLLTLSLILRTMSKEQQSLLMSHFSPEVARTLQLIEQQTAVDVEKLDWSPFYQSWPELRKILDDCNQEIKLQKVYSQAEEQRPRIKEYLLAKIGKQKKGAPVFLPQEITKIIDYYLSELKKEQ